MYELAVTGCGPVRRADRVTAFLDLVEPADDIILAAGGELAELAAFADAGHCVLAVDDDPARAGAARHALDGWPVRVDDSNLDALAYGHGAVAGAWAGDALAYLPVNAAVAAFGELARVTRPGGPVWAAVRTGGYSGVEDTSRGRRWIHHWAVPDLEMVLRAAGLAVDRLDISSRWIEIDAHVGR